MNTNVLKLIAGAGLNGLWAALVFTGHADALPLVGAISAQLTAILGYHAVTNLQPVNAVVKAATVSIQPPAAPAA
ncbi:hypothetical protein [Paraburkholderia unamae]|uniref:Uncharacterized protein n=1 Tax=Paraburkholderia unamae TaxID=219649 RepID=A0ACC6RGQ9_9BURK